MIQLSPELLSSNELITALIYGASVLFPSSIAIITLIKKNYFNKAMKELFNKVENGFKQNYESIQQIKNTLTQHTNSIQRLLESRNIANRLRQIAKHALIYCGNKDICKILDEFIEQFIAFVIDILQIGFDNTSKQQILAKMTLVDDKTSNIIKKVMGEQELKQWNNKHALLLINEYLQDVYSIYEDKINNKNARFIVKSEDFAQTKIRQFIIFVNKSNFTLENIYK